MRSTLQTFLRAQHQSGDGIRNAIIQVRCERSVVLDSFEISCREFLSAGECAVGYAYFGSLGYPKMCATSEKSSGIGYFLQRIFEKCVVKLQLTQTIM